MSGVLKLQLHSEKRQFYYKDEDEESNNVETVVEIELHTSMPEEFATQVFPQF